MQLHIDPSIRVPAGVLVTLVLHGFGGVRGEDVEVLIRAAPATMRRWVRPCRDPAACSHPIDFRAEAMQGHSAPTRRPLRMLDASLHGPAGQLAVRPRYAYSGRVRDRHRHGGTQGQRFLVTLRIPTDPGAAGDRYPRMSRDPRRRDTPTLRIESWQEELVRLAAHEARHVHQHRHGLPRSEAGAERWAEARLREFRRGQSVAADAHRCWWQILESGDV